MASRVVYKIFNPLNGLYKDKGLGKSWSQEGGTWNGIGQLKSHLRLEADYKGPMFGAPPSDKDYKFEPHWEVHVFEIIERPMGTPRIGDFLKRHPTKRS